MSTPVMKSTSAAYSKITPRQDCVCDTTMANRFEKLWNEGQCIKSSTSTEERVTCWDGNKQYISIKPIETSFTEFNKSL